jgi:hypothetical protein
MRHLGSIVLAIVFAPLMYLLAGVGQVKFVAGTARASTDWTAVSIGIGALIVAGVLYSVLVMARLSPLGPVLAAALFIGVELWAVFDAAGVADLLGNSTFGVIRAQEAPLSGLALFMAVPLIATIVSPRRWRTHEKTSTIYANAGPNYGVPVSAAPTYAPIQTSAETAAEATAEEQAEERAEERADEQAAADEADSAETRAEEKADKD